MAIPVVRGPVVMTLPTEVPVRCGKCGYHRFAAVAVSKGAGAAIKELVCERCKSKLKVDQGMIHGKLTAPEADMWKEPNYG